MFGCSDSESTKPDEITKSITEKKVSFEGLKYLQYLPSGYNKSKSYPLVLFLHGSGQRGSNIDAIRIYGPQMLIDKGKEFPFILISPQCPEYSIWNTSYLYSLINQVKEEHNIDTTKIYCTGLSMGGYATWELATRYPKIFAACVPICGGGNVNEAYKLKDMSIWVFHGVKDNMVPITESQKMVDAIKACGGTRIKFTAYPEALHDSWSLTYSNQELYEWLLNQRLMN